VEPTVFSGVTSTMRIAQEEIFGPLLCILPYDDDEEAIQIANDSIYCLSGAIWSANVDRAVAPFGGHKQSGIGRELGEHGLKEFLEIKTIQVPAEAEK
jgi:aldehyde dehydrogenase (NAD+)